MAENFKRSVEWFLARRGDREEQFKLAQQKAMAKKKFPPEFELPVNMQTVDLEVVKPWISRKVEESLSLPPAFFVYFLVFFFAVFVSTFSFSSLSSRHELAGYAIYGYGGRCRGQHGDRGT